MSTRGIVVTPPFTVEEGALSFRSGMQPDPIAIRRALLYWDQIDFPINNIIHIGETDEFRFLMEAGVAKRTRVVFQGFIENGTAAYVYAQVAALLENSKRAPGSWSLCQTGDQLFLPSDISSELRTIEVELYQALPAPPDDIPFPDILDFKRKRNSELAALRSALDDVYLEVVNSADLPRAKTAAIDRLDRVLADVRRTASESWGQRLIPKVQVALNLPQGLSAGAAAAVAAMEFALPLSMAAAAGVIASAVRFDWGSVARARELPPELKPYAYLLSAQKELRA